MDVSDAAALVVTRADGGTGGEDWTENFEELPGGAGVSIILESTSRSGVGPRLHRHPYAETFVIRRGSAGFTIGAHRLTGRAGQVLVVPAGEPHKFITGPDGYEAVHIHANPRFVTDWLE
ncbi:cupin domain-containing protein [Amycolatopsis endophytica]|uniref:Quercetin dioxygenase-like cupin family protein n=1 Tax=Amycolatopsis endophytica TaxID=860233 RepID=A0A853BED0_9PSEU|nr:cupin domain-containing protein [Amycolatopsis endophytica]NYI93135.1 quercetin dioxygenase-like cupin family protein [Amycolatopsis endophytica]